MLPKNENLKKNISSYEQTENQKCGVFLETLITIPSNPPNKMFPQYHPSILDETVTILSSYPGKLILTRYSSPEKNPLLDFNLRLAGVVPA